MTDLPINKIVSPAQLLAALLPLFSERNVSHDQTMSALKVMKIPLPTSKMIQKIQIRVKLDYTNGGTPPTLTEDELTAFITKIRILGNGDTPIRNTTGTIQYFRELMKTGTAPEKDTLTVTASTNFVDYLTLTIYFQKDWNNPNDISALLPARRFDELNLEVTLGDSASIASANAPTINYSSCEVAVDVTEVHGAGIFKTKYADIHESYKDVTIAAANATFESDDIQEDVLPVKSSIVEHTILAIDNNLRDNDIITDVMLKRNSPIDDEMFKRKFNRLQAENKTQYKAESAVTGLLILDYKSKFGRILDRKTHIQDLEPKGGDVKLHFLNIAPTGTSKYFLHTVWVK